MIVLKRASRLTAVVAGLLSASCSSSSSAPADVADLPPTLAASICAKFDECVGDAAAVFLPGGCTDMFAAQLADQQVPLWEAGIAAGTLTYNSGLVSACRDALAAADCSVLGNGFPAACDAVFTGSVATAGACNIDEECAGDAYCDTDAACPGACAATVAAGGACRQDTACQGDLACDGGVCTAPTTVGATCDGPSAPSCGGGLLNCIGATDTTAGTCQPISDAFTVARGEACDLDAGRLCVSGSVCALISADLATEALTWMCEAPASAGGACHLGLPDPCPSSQYCNADPENTGSFDGTCTDLPVAGSPCLTGPTQDLGKTCAPGTACDGELCATTGRLGDPCTGDQGCASDHCADRVCTTPTCG